MDHIIYSIPQIVDTEGQNYIKDLHDFYFNKIISPKCNKVELLKKLYPYYSFEIVEKTHAKNLFDIISIDDISSDNIWKLQKNIHSSNFYKYQTLRFFDDAQIYFAYVDCIDTFVSNCSMFELYISYLRGVDNINLRNPEYKHYLNNIYMYNCCLKEILKS